MCAVAPDSGYLPLVLSSPLIPAIQMLSATVPSNKPLPGAKQLPLLQQQLHQLAAPSSASTSDAERLRLYRKWYHELDRRRSDLHSDTPEGRRTQGLLDAEIRCLEELIILSTELGNMYSRSYILEQRRASSNQPASLMGKNKLVTSGETWSADSEIPPVEGLDLSLITDMLMLSATSPWIVYVAERAQWTLCYISPSCKRILGWKQPDLVGSVAWEGCHPDDVSDVQRMLSDGDKLGGRTQVVHYRRMRRNCSYATVQATGRPLGARWYAWVELLISNVPDLSSASSTTETAWISPEPILALSPITSPAMDSPKSTIGASKSHSMKQSSEEHDQAISNTSGLLPRKISPGLTQSNSLHRSAFSLPRGDHEAAVLRRAVPGAGPYSLPYDSDVMLQIDKGRASAAVMGSKLGKIAPVFDANKVRDSRGRGGLEEEGGKSDRGAERDELRALLPITGANASEDTRQESAELGEEVETIWRKGARNLPELPAPVARSGPTAPSAARITGRRPPGPPPAQQPGPGPGTGPGVVGGAGLGGTLGASAVVVSKPRSTQAMAGAGPPQEDLSLIRGQKVLLVEDNVVNRTMGQRLLESLGCQVTVTCNGKEALEVMQGNIGEEFSVYQREGILEGEELPPQFDLVLMDLIMPVLDGLRAVEQFRDWESCQTPKRRRMLIFAVTSNVTDGDMVKCAQSGFDEFVSKPLTWDKLIHRLRSVLNQRGSGKPRSLDSSL